MTHLAVVHSGPQPDILSRWPELWRLTWQLNTPFIYPLDLTMPSLWAMNTELKGANTRVKTKNSQPRLQSPDGLVYPFILPYTWHKLSDVSFSATSQNRTLTILCPTTHTFLLPTSFILHSSGSEPELMPQLAVMLTNVRATVRVCVWERVFALIDGLFD